MNPDDNPFDRHIRDKMKNFTPDVSAGLWDKIEAGLARKTPDEAAMPVRRRTMPVAWRWAAAAVLLVGVLSYWASRPVPVIYLQGKTAAPMETHAQPAGPVAASRPAGETASVMPGRTPTARALPRKVRSEPIPTVTAPIQEVLPSEPAVKQTPAVQLSPAATPPSLRTTPGTGHCRSARPAAPGGAGRHGSGNAGIRTALQSVRRKPAAEFRSGNGRQTGRKSGAVFQR